MIGNVDRESKSPEEAYKLLATEHQIAINEISTNKVAVVDTTGAGDSFAAGFLYGLSKHFTFEKCAAFGNVIAGEVLKVYGPRVEKSLKSVIMS